MDHFSTKAPTAEEIEGLARQVIEDLPDAFRGPARQLALVVEEFPDETLLAEMEIEDVYELTGLYTGIPLTEKSVFDQPMQPDQVTLFRRAIIDEWAARETVTLSELIRHVLIHEIAHHFGWSDKDIAAIDRWWE